MTTRTRLQRTPPRSAEDIERELAHKREGAATLVARQLVVAEELAHLRGDDANATIEVTAELQQLMDEAHRLEHTLATLNDELVKLERAHRAAVVLLAPAQPIAPEPPMPATSVAESPSLAEETPAASARVSGVVRSYDGVKGFGFIAPDDNSARVFCHRRAIQGPKVLLVGQRVTFDVSLGQRGPYAACVIAAEDV